MSDDSVEYENSRENSETPGDNEHRGENIPRVNRPSGDSDDRELERHGSSAERRDAENPDSEVKNQPDGPQVESAQVQAMFAARSGPLPAVQDFSGYESVLPGAADRIIKMAETALDTRHQSAMADAEVQKAVARSIDNRGILERRQQSVFALVTLLALMGTFLLAWYGKTVPSILALIVAAAGGVVTYKVSQDGFKIYPTTGQSEESE
ncbi:DUF2335 domain-containing protein [Corynebacterium sp. ACRPS]|uniref:DUF2335 domain-containing protein n=1 Tax=Corynebacterium sp. ACRPS TaxID=2918194 RepID=UPI001EF62A5A|nr:DUF2335 domain-containing protein [Corynebacterium sp. ACRPS]